jgi:hypothetical protein
MMVFCCISICGPSSSILQKDTVTFKAEAQSVTKKNCEEEVQFFGTISWRELESYQKIALLTEKKKEQARFHAQFLGSAAVASSLAARQQCQA